MKYPLSFRDWLRFRVFGNHFSYRRGQMEGIKSILGLLFILVIFGIVGEMDYRDQVEQEREESQRVAATLAECMNGTAKFISEDQKTGVSCRKAEVFKL